MLLLLIALVTTTTSGCENSTNKTINSVINSNITQPENQSAVVSLVLIQIQGPGDIKLIATGNVDQNGNLGNSAACALKSDGTVWAWGNNKSGQLGIDSVSESKVPVQWPGLDRIISIAASDNTAYL